MKDLDYYGNVNPSDFNSRKDYRKECDKRRIEFLGDLQTTYNVSSPLVFYAWDKGHSYGFQSVIDELEELAEMFDAETKARL